jgi:hypothetical protein
MWSELLVDFRITAAELAYHCIEESVRTGTGMVIEIFQIIS